jgi:metal-responsive CopG/Arc/MetJ family transcriptional regulator
MPEVDSTTNMDPPGVPPAPVDQFTSSLQPGAQDPIRSPLPGTTIQGMGSPGPIEMTGDEHGTQDEAAVSEQDDISIAVHETKEQLTCLVDGLNGMLSRQASLDDRLSSLADKQAAANRESEALRNLVQEACEVKADFGRVKEGFNQLITRVGDSFSSSEQSMNALKEGYRDFAVAGHHAIAQKDDKIEALEEKCDQSLNRVLEDVIYPLHDQLFSAVVAIEAANEVHQASLIVALFEQVETSLVETQEVHVIRPQAGSTYERESMSAVDFELARRFRHQDETVARTLRCGFHVGVDEDCVVLRKAQVVVYRR